MPEKNRLGDILLLWNLIKPEDLEAALEEQKHKGGYLGQILINKGLVSSADVERALQESASRAKETEELGRMLVADKLLTEEQLSIAVERHKALKKDLDEVLVEMGLVTQKQIAQTFSRFLNLPFIQLSDYDIKLEVLQLIPERIIRDYQVIPLKLEHNTLSVAMSDPLNLLALDHIRSSTKHQILPMVAAKEEINGIISRHFNLQQMTKQMLVGVQDKSADEISIAGLVERMLQTAINARASDIHLEPRYPEMRVRFRVDGILHDVAAIPKTVEPALISRIKVLSEMDISEHRRPQDGHMSLKLAEKEYDLRVASTSTISGEKMVIRILDKSGMLLGLDELGLSKANQKDFNSLVSKPYGIILVTGPTGSGKTTTLYAVLSKVDTASKNVVTIEDPVEYKLEGINQTQVNPAANITFATGLRSILRQDPDIILVGEIRDLDTATIAIHAALTGHLVFSTLHTNDASSAIARLIDMGVEPFLVSSALVGVVAQRLVRSICPKCKEQYEPSMELIKEMSIDGIEAGTKLSRGPGCPYCMQTGYRGRTGVFEVMKVTDKLRELILQKQPATKIKELAVSEGMTTLKSSAMEKVITGVTTLEEINRVVSTSEG